MGFDSPARHLATYVLVRTTNERGDRLQSRRLKTLLLLLYDAPQRFRGGLVCNASTLLFPLTRKYEGVCTAKDNLTYCKHVPARAVTGRRTRFSAGAVRNAYRSIHIGEQQNIDNKCGAETA